MSEALPLLTCRFVYFQPCPHTVKTTFDTVMQYRSGQKLPKLNTHLGLLDISPSIPFTY